MCRFKWKPLVLTYFGLFPILAHIPLTGALPGPVQTLSSPSRCGPFLQFPSSIVLGSSSFSFPLGIPGHGLMLLDGFHTVCPLNLHLFLLIYTSDGSWLVLCLNYVLLMVPGQWIQRICWWMSWFLLCLFLSFFRFLSHITRQI